MNSLYTAKAPADSANLSVSLDELADFLGRSSAEVGTESAADRLRAWRKAMQIPIRDMAKVLGISLQMLQSIETRIRRPGLGLAVRIQRISVWYVAKHTIVVRDCDLKLPILCDEW
ncbi:MAG TPA: helix-turn-helix transcriptional regulator [Pyrinomonadaceae bacterium]|nr:helix-turn-helix transcriptional regulator [Pyrinomonadaceae bacterium]